MKRQNQLNIKRGLLSKLVLLVALFLGSSNVWGQAKSLPYNYGFGETSENSFDDEGWTMNVGGTSGIYNSSTSYVHTGAYDFRFLGSTDPQYIFSPELENSASGIDVSFYYNGFSAYSSRTFNVGYSTTNTEISSFTWLSSDITYTADGWFQFNGSFPTGTKFIAIRHTAISQYQAFFIDDFSVTKSTSYKMPTSFTVDSFTDNSATFSWTAGSDESSWRFAYSTDADFTPNTGTAASITANPYTLTGLTEGTTYYACICADYGDGHYSDWTEKVSFTPRNETDLTIYNGTNENTLAPINGYRASNITYSQLIIPSSEISSIQGRQITKLTFYAKEETVNWGSAKFEVYLKETSLEAFPGSNYELESWGTIVYSSGSLSVSNNKMEIILDTPFNYSSGNLLIGIKQTVAGTGNTATWYGTDTYTSGIGLNQYGVTKTRISYPRKVTFTTTAVSSAPVKLDGNSYTTFASKWPLDLTALPSGLKAYKAEVSAKEGKVRFTDINQKVAANTGILLAGTAGNTYRIPVADAGSTVDGNAFLVNTTGGTFDGDDDYTYFGFKKNSEPITFATFDPSTVAIPTNKAYLKVKTSLLPPAEARQLVAVFDDGETTSLREIRNEELGIKNAVFFNLNGQRVAQPTKGLYIVNGKKVLVP